MKTQLQNHLRKFSTAPFLLVGSGLSRRYLGIEDWEGLLRRFAALTPRPYEYYRATAGGDLPRAASELVKVFHETWWNSAEYEESRQLFSADARSQDSALKVEISRYLHSRVISAAPKDELEQEIEALRRAVIDGIITTNWDTFLEETFPGFRVFIGQEQLLFSAPQGVGEIYKIHGCVTNPNSLILTGEDYNLFNERNAYLAAKLLTVFVEHPVIVLGYSLSDKNVSQILRGISSCLTSANIGQLRDRLVFVSWDPDQLEPTIASSNLVVPDGFPIPILEVRTSTLLPVFEALAEIPRVFPARVLRQLKEHVYRLVKDNDPRGRLYVKDIDDSAEVPAEIEVVFGVGAIAAVKEIGYRGLTRDDLIHDVLSEAGGFDAKQVVEGVLPRLLRHNKYLPIFRYLRLAGYLNDSGDLQNADGMDPRLADAAKARIDNFAPPRQYKSARVVSGLQSFAELASSHPPEDVVMYAALLPESALDLSSIKTFLVQNREGILRSNDLVKTQYIKLVCLFDWLAYKKGRAALSSKP